jgi:hypothetical protein
MKALALIVGILAGSIIGGVLGLLLGLGAIALPSSGPMIAAGTLATALGTAAIGMIAGLLLGGAIALLLSLNTRRSLKR